MKHLHTFESFLQEISAKSLNEKQKMDFKFTDWNTIDKNQFSKLMPKTAKTSSEATENMKSREGEKVTIDYKELLITPKGNKPNQPTYLIYQSEYSSDKEKINISRLTINDASGPREKPLGTAYVFTDTFLSELKDSWTILPSKKWESLATVNEAKSLGSKISSIWNKYKNSGMDMNFGDDLQSYYDDEELPEELVDAIDSLKKSPKDLVDFSTVNDGVVEFPSLLADIKKSGLKYKEYNIDHGGPAVVVENK